MSTRALFRFGLLSLVACGGTTSTEYEAVDVAAIGTSGGEGARAAADFPDAPVYEGPLDGFERINVPVDGQPQRGPSDAPVTMVVFSDFECPFCSRLLPALETVFERYPGQIRIVWRNYPLPFHRDAEPAAHAAMEAFAQGGASRFWRMHDMLFANQGALGREDLLRYGAVLGMDTAALATAIDSQTHADVLAADLQLARAIGVRGTPATFVNGELLSGARPAEDFDEAVRKHLTLAHRAMQQGIAPANLYAHFMSDAQAAPTPAAPSAPAPRQQPDPNAVYNIPVTAPAPQRGPDDALVTIIEVSDFQCPFCSRAEPTIDEIITQYGNDVRVVFMNNPLPFHNTAMPAAEAALEAFAQNGNAGFWAMHALLFANQREQTRANLEQWASQTGLDLQRFRAALDGHTHQADIEAHQAIARNLGATGTPSFFINGRNLRGAQPLATFQALIDEELTKARALVSSGTPRAQVYEATIRDGATTPQTIMVAPAAAAAPPDPNQDYGIPVAANAPSRGDASAQVVIQVFSDFQCPFCNRVRATLDEVLQEYDGRVRLVWRDYPLPFHTEAHLAAEAAREVFQQGGNEAFWAYHDVLFDNPRNLSETELVQHAAGISGVNTNRLRRALADRTHQAAVDADIQAVTDANVRIGTPSFFINGRLTQGAQPIEGFRTAIDRELAR